MIIISKSNCHPLRTAVREIHLEHLDQGLDSVQGYKQALVVFRLRGTVVGQAWLPVEADHISSVKLRESVSGMAWPIWQQLMSQRPDTAQPLPTATVVVCTRDRTDDLAECLPGLSRLASQGHELIVVDSCPSNDSTAHLVASYPMIRYVYEPRPGAGIARNRGLLAATQEIVAFTDDDVLVDAGWLTALLRNFDDPMVAAVTGITMPLELETEAQLHFERTNGFGRGFERKQFDMTNLSPLAAGLAGASVNVAIRRSALQEIGLFVEALGPGTPSFSGEDHEFFYRILARGYRIVYEPGALIWHRHRRDWNALRRTLYGYGSGVFAWWTHVLLVEREFTLFFHAPRWFWQHHIRNLVQSLLRRRGRIPLDLAWAEFSGALVGPINYLRSRRWLRQYAHSPVRSEPFKSASHPASIPITDKVSAPQVISASTSLESIKTK